MPVDPRLDSVLSYVTSQLGGGPTDDMAMLRQRVADLERMVQVLLRTPNVQVSPGPPTLASRDGTLCVDSGNLRLYVHVLGAWRYLGPFN